MFLVEWASFKLRWWYIKHSLIWSSRNDSLRQRSIRILENGAWTFIILDVLQKLLLIKMNVLLFVRLSDIDLREIDLSSIYYRDLFILNRHPLWADIVKFVYHFLLIQWTMIQIKWLLHGREVSGRRRVCLNLGLWIDTQGWLVAQIWKWRIQIQQMFSALYLTAIYSLKLRHTIKIDFLNLPSEWFLLLSEGLIHSHLINRRSMCIICLFEYSFIVSCNLFWLIHHM